MNIEKIIKKARENDPKADIDFLRLAFDFADLAHKGQKRRSGEPYIQHSLHTAYTLAEIKADLNTIIAGLLHDVPEDTEKTLEDIEKNFGKEISTLVEGITKLSHIKYRGQERYIESLRKMFLAMASDLRVAFIKFADRLHNLKTLDALPEQKRQRIAQETLEIISPIAGLLGMEELKWQMEDICFKYLYPREFEKIKYQYEVEKKKERNQYFEKVKNILAKELNKAGVRHKITTRFKHLYSIWKKMENKNRKFNSIYDVFAFRVVVDNIPDCYRALGIIHALWPPAHKRFKDYISMPKPNGYRSLHTTVFGLLGQPTEFQIRTKEMDEESSYGIAAHWYYKKEGRKSHLVKQPQWVKSIMELQRESESSLDFINRAKIDVFRDHIFAFTPRGDVIDLIAESTPVDFAYNVHTDIGNQCTGAMINGKMASLDTPLKNGDVVDIIRDKNRKGPNRAWLKFAKTHRARSKIKQFSPRGLGQKFKSLLGK